jgi:DNA repair photolyase
MISETQQKSNVLTNSSHSVIVSASRSTDIPAFYTDWLISRIKAGYVKWKNPFSGKLTNVTFEQARLFVFWTKNPAPMLDKLAFFDNSGFSYYFQYTLNDYENENWESGLPPLDERIETFIRLSERIGKEKLIWRFDPIILSDKLGPDEILRRVERIGDILHKHTERLVFSFIDIENYRKVKHNLCSIPDNIHEIDTQTMEYLAKGISQLNECWGLELGTCAEKIDLELYGIEHNRCIDDRLIIRLFPHDNELMTYLGYTTNDQTDFLAEQTAEYTYQKIKDKGQRKACGCIKSKDIGQYNTCPHGCVYCYANTDHETALMNWQKAQGKELDTII